MSINSLIENFELFILGKNKNSEKTPDVNVYSHSDEFKSYLKDELRVLDSTVISASMSEILEMDVVEGELVIENPEDEEINFDEQIGSDEEVEEETDETAQEGEVAEDETVEEETKTNKEIIGEILNNFFSDEQVIEKLDTNNDGELDKTEIETFLTSISAFDENKDDISLEDIIFGIDALKKQEEQEETLPVQNEVVTDNVAADYSAAPTYSSAPSSYSSGGSYSGGSNASYSAPAQNQEKSYENMTKEELQGELSTVQGDLTTQQGKLASINNGTEPTLKAQDAQVQGLYDTYQAELKKVDVDMANQVDELKQKIDAKEDEIDTKNQEISNQETTVTQAQGALERATSTRQSLENALPNLEGADTSKMSEEEKSAHNGKISELKGKIAQAKSDETEAQTNLTKAQEKLAALNGEKGELQTQLNDLNTDMGELETQIAEKHPEIKQYLDAYKTAKQQYDSDKQTAATQTSEEIKNTQGKINDIEAAINELNNKETAKEYSVSGSDLYDEQAGKHLVDTAYAMLNKYGSTSGYCATGVSRTISMAYGISMGGNGCDWDTNMDKLVSQGLFTEATDDYATSADLSNLPAGAVVCWENTGGKNGGGAQYGHVTIADGKGGEISDHYAANIYKTIGGRSDQYRVFLPIG